MSSPLDAAHAALLALLRGIDGSGDLTLDLSDIVDEGEPPEHPDVPRVYAYPGEWEWALTGNVDLGSYDGELVFGVALFLVPDELPDATPGAARDAKIREIDAHLMAAIHANNNLSRAVIAITRIKAIRISASNQDSQHYAGVFYRITTELQSHSGGW